MINFHRYGFLDAKKLANYLQGTNFWLCQMNPYWLFIWSDKYKPEIAFTNRHVFIRFNIPEVGMCYYPPLGGDLKQGMDEIKEDVWERQIDFNLGVIPENELFKYPRFKLKMYENEAHNSYIYNSIDLAFTKVKSKLKLMQKFALEHPNTYFKKISKEEFPQILEFINYWNIETESSKNDINFYNKLNMIKRCIEHLYELDLIGIMLKDEERIYGVAIGSVMNNLCNLHLCIALPSISGAYESLVSAFSKNVSTQTRYISLEEVSGDKDDKKNKKSYKPFKIEKFYSTFTD